MRTFISFCLFRGRGGIQDEKSKKNMKDEIREDNVQIECILTSLHKADFSQLLLKHVDDHWYRNQYYHDGYYCWWDHYYYYCEIYDRLAVQSPPY